MALSKRTWNVSCDHFLNYLCELVAFRSQSEIRFDLILPKKQTRLATGKGPQMGLGRATVRSARNLTRSLFPSPTSSYGEVGMGCNVSVIQSTKAPKRT
jgi:hypothetical protein